MSHYDVIIVGAGPGGGECARELTKRGVHVLLTEKAPEFGTNNFSSGGAPQELIEMFSLPDSVIGTTWNKFRVSSSNDEQLWSSNEDGGVVLDFKKLRTYLADDAIKNGGELKLGHMYEKHETLEDGLISVSFKVHGTNEHITYDTKVLVDATGAERQVLKKREGAPYFEATGLEYLIEVTDNQYDKWKNSLSFFLGKKWMPQGYSWVFPMEPNKLKVGVGRYFKDEQFIPLEKTYKGYLENMLKECLGTVDVPILEKHGKTLHYTYHRDDIHYDRNVIAIGDSISTLNPLGLEGIRHAMVSAHIASKHIERYLRGDILDFLGYKKEVDRYIGYRWRVCEYIMKKIYREPIDSRIDSMIYSWKHFSFDEIMDFAFNYKLKKLAKFLTYYMYHLLFSKKYGGD